MTAEPIAGHYEKLLVLRLVQLADTFREDAPELSARTGFADAWHSVESWPAGVLQAAVHQPLVDRWVATGEHLVAAGVHQRYPDSHPSRHLREFSRLVLSWASEAPDGASGRVPELGRRSLPLVFGRALLWTDSAAVASSLSWEVRGRQLSIAEAGVRTVAEIDLAELSRSTVTAGRWSLVVLPSAHGILVDLQTPEYVGEPIGGAAALAEAIGGALDTMDDQTRALVTTYARCITLRHRPGPWTAGLIALPGGTEADLRTQVLREIHRDRLTRWLILSMPSLSSAPPASPLSDLRAALADQGAARMLESANPQAPPWPVLQDLLPAPRSLPRTATGDDELLSRDPFGAESGSVLPLPDLPAPAGSPAARLTLTKTRSGTHRDLDWSALNELSRLGPDQLQQLRHSPAPEASNAEAADFFAALIAYALDDWNSCVFALQRCLAHDDDVEEYWVLLGFARRHAGDPDDFDRIVLSGDRRMDAATAR